jgi:hypothetical protein
MLRTPRLLQDRESSLLERLGLGIAALRIIDRTELVHRERSRGMIRARNFFGRNENVESGGHGLK